MTNPVPAVPEGAPRDLVTELVTALKALRALSDTNCPRKFDEALPWIANDRVVREMIDVAIQRADAALRSLPVPEGAPPRAKK